MSTKLRPECGTSTTKPVATQAYLLQVLNRALQKRRGLAFGQLTKPGKGGGSHCAMGCFFEESPSYCVPATLIDEVAAVNDSVPLEAGSRLRMKVVRNWVKARAAALGILLS